MKSYRAILVALAAAVLTAALSSCAVILPGNPSGTTAAETDAAGETIVKVPTRKDVASGYFAALTEYDLTDVSVVVASTDENTLFPETRVTTYDAALFARAAVIKGRYGVTVAPILADTDEIKSSLVEAKASGFYYADLAIISRDSVWSFYNDGLLQNMRSLPFVNLEAPYYTSRGEFESVGGIYAAESFASLCPDDLSCVFFNKKLQNADELYAKARDGELTRDAFLSLAKEGGVLATKAIYGKLPDEYRKVIKSDSEAVEEFANGDYSFMLASLGDSDAIVGMADSFGILPLVDEDGGALALRTGGAGVFILPAGASRLAESGIVLEALSALSYALPDDYIESRMYFTVRDEPSLSMMRMILDKVG